jgi:PPOX class probable F420-dependent enzyme
VPALTPDEMSDFLAERQHLMRIGTVDVSGIPRVVPIWFMLRAGKIYFTPRAKAVFFRNIQRDPRVALSIDEEALPYRKVSIQGTAEIMHPAGEDEAWRPLYVDLADRYIAEGSAEDYVMGTADQPRPLLAVALANSTVSTWRMPIQGEAGSGIWARRYYAPGTEDRLKESPLR